MSANAASNWRLRPVRGGGTDDYVLFGPEHGCGAGAGASRPGLRRGLHSGARANAAFFSRNRNQTLYEYYRTISEAVDIGIALWSHPDSGYLMSPQLCNRLADLETVVAIKYSVPRPRYAELTQFGGRP